MIIIIKLDRVLLLKGAWPDNKYTCRIAGKQGGGKDCATYRITVDNFFNALIEALDYDIDVSEYQSDTSFFRGVARYFYFRSILMRRYFDTFASEV